MHFKLDHEPILGPGRHYYTVEKFIEDFSFTQKRREITNKFLTLINELENLEINIEIWINGSFVTKKDEPTDLDIVIVASPDQIDGLQEEQKEYFNNFPDFSEEYYLEFLDVFFFIKYPESDAKYSKSDTLEDWAFQWSRFHNSNFLKGFVIVPIGENNG